MPEAERAAPPPVTPSPREDGGRDVWITASDGLRLYARDYGPRDGRFTPVLCLAGLTRNSADFEALAEHLSRHRHRPRRVLALDSRGRGRSEHARDKTRYDILVETRDALDAMAEAGMARACVIGTSRGGILAMVMAALRPSALAGLVLNDIGPKIEGNGLVRIKTYVDRMRAPATWAEAVTAAKAIGGGQFPAFGPQDWERFARATFADMDGRPALAFDKALMHTLEDIDTESEPPSLWPQFEALAGLPVLALRGENSDILSPATLAEMGRRHAGLESHVVPGQGHAPALAGPDLPERIAAFLARVDASEGHAPARSGVRPDKGKPGRSAGAPKAKTARKAAPAGKEAGAKQQTAPKEKGSRGGAARPARESASANADKGTSGESTGGESKGGEGKGGSQTP